MRIHPLSDLGSSLLSVQNPARYLGGEFGQIIKQKAVLTVALAFPDLYEIAMSNLAVKILYNAINRIDTVRCERVFAPAPDFEALLKKKQFPLYTLESGIPVHKADIIAVSIGYEPGINGLLSILDTGGVPLQCSERIETSPIVIAGGCGITNPLPFTKFIDVFYIGEAEDGFFDLIKLISVLKENGASRSDIIAELEKSPYIWTQHKQRSSSKAICTTKAVYRNFSDVPDSIAYLPVPNIRIVQDHGSVEIMRGCPNGCRFCHAGIYYRPQRMRSINQVISDVDLLVSKAGFREISLMSLSSGDYEHIDSLMNRLNQRYSARHISFQLPSLKVNSFTLPLLEKMASVRKSGLTFAVETPVDAWQLSLNKEVYKQRIIDIILEAKLKGWNQCKFYFMIGLPVEQGTSTEEIEIVDFLLDVYKQTKMYSSVNIGTFIPKPHTPYQWSKQLTLEEAQRKIDYVYKNLPKKYFKLSTHKPFNSLVEGMISRGDERVGDLILEAYTKGCRLDAWDDWARPDIWKEVIGSASWNVEKETTRERDINENLPWDSISLGPTKKYLITENKKSEQQLLTPSCSQDCEDKCGVCNNSTKVTKIDEPDIEHIDNNIDLSRNYEASFRVLISFTKQGVASFIPHLSMLELWHKTFLRSSIPVVYSEGFNPLPKFELAQTLSIGISSEDEIASFLLYEHMEASVLKELLNNSLPESIQVQKIAVYTLSRSVKRESLSKFFWGTMYEYSFFDISQFTNLLHDQKYVEFLESRPEISIDIDTERTAVFTACIPFKFDRGFRDCISAVIAQPLYEICSINKISSLAAEIGKKEVSTFFDVFNVTH